MAERAGLENRWGRKALLGSNPSLSAIFWLCQKMARPRQKSKRIFDGSAYRVKLWQILAVRHFHYPMKKQNLLFAVPLLLVVLSFFPVLHTTVAGPSGLAYYPISPIEKWGIFLDRERQFHRFASEITAQQPTDEKKILAIDEWTKKHVRDIPDGWETPPDDHELNILVRGYGTPLDRSRIFCILATFAGFPGLRCGSPVRCLVRIHGQWVFVDTMEPIASLELRNPWFVRGHLQMLWPRIRYEILKRVLNRKLLYDHVQAY